MKKNGRTLFYDGELNQDFNFLALRNFLESKGFTFEDKDKNNSSGIVFSKKNQQGSNIYLLPHESNSLEEGSNYFFVDYNNFENIYGFIVFTMQQKLEEERCTRHLRLSEKLESEIDQISTHQFLEENIFQIEKFLDLKKREKVEIDTIENYLSLMISDLILNETQKFGGLNFDNSGDSLETIDLPTLVIGPDGATLFHNSEFLELNILPVDCLPFKSQDTINIHDKLFKVYRFEIEVLPKEFATTFIFYSRVDVGDENLEHSELGIISGSIAHELNNPIGGILAAISLLEIDYEFGGIHEELMEMREGALRCKELIDIFLGLSKIRPEGKQKFSLENAFDRALNLLSFRMVEINTCCEFSYSGKDEKFDYNISIITMIFYLILNELLTVFSRKKLVDLNLNSLVGEISSLEGEISISINEKVGDISKIKESKLLGHLLALADLVIEIKDQNILIKGRS